MSRVVAVNERGLRIGESHPLAKLTDAEVDKVFELVEEGLTSREIAAIMDVSLDTVKKIRCGDRRGQVAVRYKVVHVSD